MQVAFRQNALGEAVSRRFRHTPADEMDAAGPFVTTRLGAHQSYRRLPLGNIVRPWSRPLSTLRVSGGKARCVAPLWARSPLLARTSPAATSESAPAAGARRRRRSGCIASGSDRWTRGPCAMCTHHLLRELSPISAHVAAARFSLARETYGVRRDLVTNSASILSRL
jgi:hypothetical protein